MDRRAQTSTSDPKGSPEDQSSSTSAMRTRPPDPAKLHPDNAQVARIGRSLYKAPLSEKKAIVQKLMEIHRHNIGALLHASTQPRDKVEMLLKADFYLRLKDKARRDKFKDDVTLLQEMREKTVAQVLELQKMMEKVEDELRRVGRPRPVQEQDQPGQLREQNQSGPAREQNQPRQARDESQPRQARDENQPRQARDESPPSWGQKRTRTIIKPC